MSLRKILRSVAAVAAAVGSLAAVAPAGAAVVIASFDPAVGPLMPNTGYQGSAQFFIADACLALSGDVANSNACSDNTMAVQSATVEFYSLSNPSNILATLSFPGTGFTVNAARIFAGEVEGFDTSFATPAQFLQLDGFLGDISLRFALGVPDVTSGGVDLQLCVPGRDCVLSPNRATNITFTRVPEPATLALVGLAAFGAAAASRRKKA